MKNQSASEYSYRKLSHAKRSWALVRAANDPSSLRQAIRKAVQEINKAQPLTDVKTLEQIKAESIAPNRLRSTLPGVFAGIAGVAGGDWNLWVDLVFCAAAHP
jgi:hypothetical protein